MVAEAYCSEFRSCFTAQSSGVCMGKIATGERVMIHSYLSNSRSMLTQHFVQPWNLFMESMIAYRNIYGHVLVPASFVVPRHDDNWPKACWDLPIGSVVQRLRLRHDFLTGENAVDRRKQLDGLGFVWDVSEYNFLRFFMALKHFERLSREKYSSSRDHTSIRVPSTFVVPSGEENG